MIHESMIHRYIIYTYIYYDHNYVMQGQPATLKFNVSFVFHKRGILNGPQLRRGLSFLKKERKTPTPS